MGGTTPASPPAQPHKRLHTFPRVKGQGPGSDGGQSLEDTFVKGGALGQPGGLAGVSGKDSELWSQSGLDVKLRFAIYCG